MFFTESFSSVHFERYHFVALDMAEDFSLHHALHVFSYGEFAIRAGEQYIGKFQVVAGVSFNPGNIKCLVFLDPELATCDLYNCEHNDAILGVQR
jgi:hypothetical protein